MVAGPQTLDEIYRYIIVNDLGAQNPADVTLGVLLLAMGAAIGGGGSGFTMANSQWLASENGAGSGLVDLIQANSGDQVVIGSINTDSDVVLRSGGQADIAFDPTYGSGAVFAAHFFMAGPTNAVFVAGGFANANDVIIAYDGRLQVVTPSTGTVAPQVYLNDLRTSGHVWYLSTGLYNEGHFELTDGAVDVPAVDIAPGSSGSPGLVTISPAKITIANNVNLGFLNSAGGEGSYIIQDTSNNLSIVSPSNVSAVRFLDAAFANLNLAILDSGTVLLGRTNPGTTATTGFPYLPASAGAPTGTPNSEAGFVPFYYDTTNHKIWVYDGSWRGVVVA